MSTYLETPQDLDRLLEGAPSSAVILNEAREEGDALPLSQVLTTLLRGPTRSFTALVGYFGHRVDETAIEQYGSVTDPSGFGQVDGEDPAGLVVREAVEENLREGQSFGQTAFRLLAGAMSSPTAQGASRAWYWLCRFRHEAPEGREATDRLREAFTERADSPDHSFVDAATALLEPGAYGESPFNLGAEEFASRLDRDGEENLEQVLEETLFANVVGEAQTRLQAGAAILVGFFLQRRADFRINPHGEQEGPIFHPKIYVVERGEDGGSVQTGSIVGSHNWTVPGLGLDGASEGPSRNVEVATLHLGDGHHWAAAAHEEHDLDGALSGRVCGTARHLFQAAEFTLGAWDRDPDNRLPAGRLKETTENRAGELQLKRDTESRETFRSLLVYLRRLVADLSHLDLENRHDEFFDRFRLTGQFEQVAGSEDDMGEDGIEVLFGGKIPASYQVDGAVRLLSILEGAGSGDGARGAFLTDEAGLGKTLSAKMALAIQAATRLAERGLEGAPLRMSLIVPAALTGSAGEEGEAPSGWHLHAREVRRATRALLRDVCQGVEPDEAEALTAEDRLQIKVFSQGIFSPSTEQLPDAESKEEIAEEVTFGESFEGRLDDYQFIAESELVSIDESHAFRNQESKRTRVLRLLLSLPVPGEEEWDLVPPSGEDFSASSEAFPDGIERRVLCLSATPFNNEIEDIITQIGHFAQHQDWERPYGTVGQTEMSGEGFQRPLDQAIETWQTSTDLGERAEAFRTIVQYARRHLHRTRKLSVPADQIEEKRMQGETEKLRSRYDDLGPEYVWGAEGSDYREAFATALDWLDDEEQSEEEDVDPEELKRKQFQARQKLEGILLSLFVQRSRVRALRIIEAAGATTSGEGTTERAPDVSEMFREPRRPRQPLALNRRHRAEETGEGSLEASILDNLFRLLYPTDSGEGAEEGSGGGDRAPQLSLKAYEVSALRGQRSVQAARNAIGFQVTNLIKRLQSSPYSFFRTLVRGLLRRSLIELALVERLLDGAESGDIGLPDEVDGEVLRENLDAMSGRLTEFPALPNVVELMEGEYGQGGYGRPSLVGLSGLEEGEDGGLSHPDRQVDVEGHFEEMCHLLGDEDERARWDPSFEDPGPGEERQGWVSLLLSQVEDGLESALWQDISAILEVADDLSHRIWGKESPETDVGRPFDDIWKERRTAPPEEAEGMADWLGRRLETDERARTLMAWLLVQTAARSYAEDRPARAFLRGGGRTLIFTEYSDTQDYLLALFAALYVVFQEPGQAGRRAEDLRERLIEEMQGIVSDLHQQSERVTQADAERFHFADPTTFASPIAKGAEGWFDDWVGQVEDTPSLFAEIVEDLCETFLRVRGDEADRLLEEEDIAPRGEAEGEELSIGSLSLDSQVDAFSPWYQLEPESDIEKSEEALGYVRRLEEAARFPVHTILTTDVLAEGVNLQECGVVVHYDLPWNPTKLIQRNGRIDRRLNPTFEKPARRKKLHEELAEAASHVAPSEAEEGWRAPEFYPPEQVYHLTVLPIEPEIIRSGIDPSLATRVSESLREKLGAIRTLFGLSNWPIVLTHEDTQEVLTGELDFETPGFRRREDLFAALRQLEDSATEANERYKSVDAQLSVHLRVPREARLRLVDLFADPEDPGTSEAWERVVAAGVTSWTKPRPESRTVYSDTEWKSALGSDLGALSGVLVVEDEEADGGYSFITWGVARGTGVRDTVGRRILPAYIRPTDVEEKTAEVSFQDLTTLAPLGDWESLEGAAPSAPSDLAADLVKTVIDIALDQGITERSPERKDDPYPDADLGPDIPSEFADFLKGSSFLNTIIETNRTVSKRPGFGDEPTELMLLQGSEEEAPEGEPAFNLWVTFEE
ncbi:helicase-related protein [Salinibacter ruber]|uniref:Helicase C-terminal domain-containing protein n=1 Tax=Salinibacter ruber TaxID=146919 RepID=A0A9X2UBV4_9BACT|nr:helicase-related protein [Salinibacter ruber]MCS3953473.1 hypothetical protein [Salinibacter ruber]